ncbi:recombinase family protein [Kitasatospora terrestris]
MTDIETIPEGRKGAAAIYLRCYPQDSWHLLDHRPALNDHARRLGLGTPAVYLDNGCRSIGSRPALDSLIEAVEQGLYATVLVPGPFVFALDEAAAAAVVGRLEAAGCRVVVAPPSSDRTVADMER